MKNKILLVIVIITILGISAYWIYSFPIQKYFAEKKLEQYVLVQGTSLENIESKQILKDYKIGGYTISIIYKDDSEYRYEYQYFPGNDTLTDSMNCTVFDKQNIEVETSNRKFKYPPIK